MTYFKMAHIYSFPTVLYPLQRITMTTSMYTTVILAFERYYAVSKPFSTFVNSGSATKKRVLTSIGLVCMFAIIFNMPKFFEFYVQWCSVGCLDGHELPIREYDVANNETLEEFQERIQEVTNNMDLNEGSQNASVEVITKLHFHWNDFRLYPNYKLYYINIAQNLVTGFDHLL